MSCSGILCWTLKKRMIYLKSATSNLSKSKFRAKIILKFRIIIAIFVYFWAEIWKYYCNIWNHCPQICLAAKFGAKIKVLKFGTKSALFEYFGCEFGETILIFEFSSLEFVWYQSLVQKQKFLNFRHHMLYLGISRVEYIKTIVIFEINALEFLCMRIFMQK